VLLRTLSVFSFMGFHSRRHPFSALENAHELVPRQGIGRFFPEWFKNQPWNLVPIPELVRGGRTYSSKAVHLAVHGRSRQLSLAWYERFWYGTPKWFMNLNINLGLRASSTFSKIGDPPENVAIFIEEDGTTTTVDVSTGKVVE
ncbi:hypothetical protein, partial [Haloferula sp. A504]|uniref:hypothetical protein n=1 Tax=Haloferula sp. A504 TaxID=3373601 RepID=UPI0031C19062|nr:hypothetical protein [Verrucomicrobiaceae bacterium E54]